MNYVFILGATATGKSTFAFQEACKRKAPILNCDSMQVYKGMAIGSAQPKEEQKKTIDHHLYNFVGIGTSFTVGDYLRKTKTILEQIKSPLVFFVGGSGFFVQALQKGLWPAPKTSLELRQTLEKRAQEEGLEKLYLELSKKDPVYSQKIHPKDSYRIQRALAIMETEKRSITDIKKNFEQKYSKLLHGKIIKIGLLTPSKEVYKKKVIQRIESMMASGLIEETKNLLKHSGTNGWPPLKSIGYKEVIDFLEGRLKKEDLVECILQHTLKLAKKQKTWFQKDPDIHWFSSKKEAESFLKEKLPLF